MVLLQLTGFFCVSFQSCDQKGDFRYFKIIDQWWTDPGVSNEILSQYDNKIICDTASAYSNHINFEGNRYSVLVVENITEPITLSFAHNKEFKYSGIIVTNNCCFKSIKEDALINFIELQEVNMKQNNFLFLPNELFASSAKLKTVDLSYNNISIIGNTTFRSNSILNLNLKHNQLNNLNFTLPRTLKNLELSFNLISHIQKDFFFGLTALLTLSLENNNLKTLPVGCFKDLNQLQVLSLSSNQINNFLPHAGIFTGLHSITTLEFSNNSLLDVSGLLTQSLENLNTINIENNCISVCDAETVKKVLRNLHVININNNFFNCSYLKKILSEYEEYKIFVKAGQEYFTDNIKGISCKAVQANTFFDKEKGGDDGGLIASSCDEKASKFLEQQNSNLKQMEKMMNTVSVFFILICIVVVSFSFVKLSYFLYVKLQLSKRQIFRRELPQTYNL